MMAPRLRTVLGATVTVVAVAAAGAAALGFGGSNREPASGDRLPAATAKVTRMTLTDTETVSGSLGYGDPTTLTARGTSGTSGSGTSGSGTSGTGASGAGTGGGTGTSGSGGTGATVTWLPAAGTTVDRGKAVYSVDAEPVVLFYGTTPPYRTLSSGVTGADVKQFEENLRALGYTGFTVDDEYTGATADAVDKWQEDLGVTQTGTVTVDRIVVAPQAIRVAELKASLGGAASGPVLTYTGTVRVVSIDLDVSKQKLVKVGTAATVELPDGAPVDGTVTSVGTVATKTATGSGSQTQSTTTIDVVVEVKDQARLGTYDEAPVDVTLVADKRENVLTVPVGALVALAEGGYGVQVVEGSTTRYVPVRTGMFGGGRVEIAGDGIAEGITVGVPT
jgi:hypothetical protein